MVVFIGRKKPIVPADMNIIKLILPYSMVIDNVKLVIKYMLETGPLDIENTWLLLFKNQSVFLNL